MEIKNKVVILTGASGGIGACITKELLNGGATVCALDINEDNLNKLKKDLNNDNLYIYKVDISNKDNIEEFYKKFKKDFDKVDILINNAGIVHQFKTVVELEDDTIERVMNINFYGPLNLIRAFLKEMIASKEESSIVNVSSMGGFFPFPGQTIYGASKAALKMLSEGLYSELKDTKVHTMTVFPGAINTNILKNSNVEQQNNKDASSYKMTSPEDAAKEIIEGIELNKFRIYIGSDSKFMNLIYKFSPKKAIAFINKKMS